MTDKLKILWVFLIPIVIIYLAFTKVDMRMDITDFFFTGDDPDAAFLLNQINSDSLQRQIILSITHSNQNADNVSEFMNQFEANLTQQNDVSRVWSNLLDEHQIDQLIDLYSNNRIALYSLKPEVEIPLLFELTNLEQRAEKIKSALLGIDSLLIKKLLQKDPMLLTLDWLENIQQSFSRSIEPNDYSILFLESKAAGTDLDAQQQLQQQIRTSFEEINSKFDGVFKLDFTGVPIFATKIKSDISKDIQWVSTLSIGIIFALFILVFRSLKSLFFIALMLCTTLAGAVLITQQVFGFVHGLTLAMGATLIGICIDYFIHALIHGSAGNPEHCHQKILKIWPSLILGGITTIVGYLALGISGFPGLQQIALFSAAGIMIALLITRYIIPFVMKVFNLQLQAELGSHHLLMIISSKNVRLVLLFSVLVVFLLGVLQVKWSKSLQTFTPELEQLKINDDLIRSRMTNIVPGRFILAQANNTESALQLSEQVHIVLDELRRQDKIDAFYPVFPWIASEELQQRAITSWNHQLNSDRNERWNKVLTNSGLAIEAFSPLLKSQNNYLSLEVLKNTEVWTLLSQQLLVTDKNTTVVTWLDQHDPDSVKNALESIPGVRYFSQKDSLDELATTYRLKAQYLLICGLVVIFVLLACRFRSAIQALKVISPALLAILFVFGIAGISDRPMNMLHLIGLLLAAAVCVDYGIFYFENRSNNQPLTFQAITASALTSSASFACLAVAENPALQALAWTVSPGIIIGFLLCPVILQQACKIDS